MPLESLQCNGNPIVDLTPLRGMPLTRLDICGLVWNNTTGVVLSSLALEHLWCDISAPALAGIAGMPTLLAVNDHHVDYVRALLPHIAHALAIWRASAAPAPAEIVDALRSHATLLGESSCLERAMFNDLGGSQRLCTLAGRRPRVPAESAGVTAIHGVF